jgi:diguanylate cyclase (GGDEF)-like protein
MVSTISVSTAINTSLYIKLAIILFVVVGCGGAVILGRAMDFIEYFLYIDKLVKLPNRACCDLYINDMAKKLLPENYTCIYMTFDALVELSQKYGRSVGDEVMTDFAAIIKSFDKVYEFAGYNGSGEFVAFIANCPAQKAEVITTTFKNQVEEYNNINEGHDIKYSFAYRTSTVEGVYEIRALMRAAIADVQKQKKDNRKKEKEKEANNG